MNKTRLSLQELFEAKCRGEQTLHHDINEHLPTLSRLADSCSSIAEFGVREGNSTIAFLHGLSWSGSNVKKLYSYDIDRRSTPLDDLRSYANEAEVEWEFIEADTSKAFVPPVDLLFIDTLHTYAQIQAELKNSGHRAGQIVIHDTELNAFQGENGEDGILPAILEWLVANQEYRITEYHRNCKGLMVLTNQHYA
jgi:hypothetical protein